MSGRAFFSCFWCYLLLIVVLFPATLSAHIAFFPVEYKNRLLAVWAAEKEMLPEYLELRYRCSDQKEWQKVHPGQIQFSAQTGKKLDYLSASQAQVARKAWEHAVESAQLGSLNYQALSALMQDSLAPVLFVFLISDNFPLAMYLGMGIEFELPGKQCQYALAKPQTDSLVVEARGFSPSVRLHRENLVLGSEWNQVQWKAALDSLTPPVLVQYSAAIQLKEPRLLFENAGCQHQKRDRECFQNVNADLFPRGYSRIHLQSRLFGQYLLDSTTFTVYAGVNNQNIPVPVLQADTVKYGRLRWNLQHAFGDSLPVDSIRLQLFTDWDTLLDVRILKGFPVAGTWDVQDSLQGKALYMAVHLMGPWGTINSNPVYLALPENYTMMGELEWLPVLKWDPDSPNRDLMVDLNSAPQRPEKGRFILLNDSLHIPYQSQGKKYGEALRLAVSRDSTGLSVYVCEQIDRERRCSWLRAERPGLDALAESGQLDICVRRCDWKWSVTDTLIAWVDSLWLQTDTNTASRVSVPYQTGKAQIIRLREEDDSLLVGVRFWNGIVQEIQREALPNIRNRGDLRCPAQQLHWVMDSLGDGLSVQASWAGEPVDSLRSWTLNFYQGERVGSAHTHEWSQGQRDFWSDTVRWSRVWFERGDSIDIFGVASVWEKGRWKNGASCNVRFYVPHDTLPAPLLNRVDWNRKGMLNLRIDEPMGFEKERDSLLVVRLKAKDEKLFEFHLPVSSQINISVKLPTGPYSVEVAFRHRFSGKLFWSPPRTVYVR